jgi:hypothetical protein
MNKIIVNIDAKTGERAEVPISDQEWDLLVANAPVEVLPIRSIDARRLRLALLQLDLLDTVEAAIATLGRAAQIEWEFATEIKEDYPLVLALASELDLDTEVIFNLAITLE